MAKKDKEDFIDVCMSCFKDTPEEKDMFNVNFRFQIPMAPEPEKILIASCCVNCAKEADDINLFPVIEAMINARLIRLENPDMLFTPKEWL